MCFYNDDYDWIASVQVETTGKAEGTLKCDECHRPIREGEIVHHIHQREQEEGECLACENGECNCSEDEDGDRQCCKCDPPNYGETFDYDCCDECKTFLAAVQHTEADEGCSPFESRPSLGCMIEEIHDIGIEGAKRYFKTARREYPELAKSGYLGWLWKRMFV